MIHDSIYLEDTSELQRIRFKFLKELKRWL